MHAGMSLHHSEIRLRELRAEDSQVHLLRRPSGSRHGPSLRDRLPDGRDHVRRPRGHGYGSEATHRGGAGNLHSRNLRARRGRRHQRAAPFIRALRKDRLHHRPAETPMPDLTHRWLRATALVFAVLYAVFGALNWIVRPAVLMAFLCYASAITMLMVELGRLWMVWMVLVSWAPTSALYEVGWCAFLYLTVLALEFAQVPLEQAGWDRTFRVTRAIYIPIMLLGVTLSHLHQSSLGTLMTLIPHKINVLWWSDNLPLLYLFSAM